MTLSLPLTREPGEIAFMQALLPELCNLPGVRVHRQNVGTITFRDAQTRRVRVFDAGPPEGASDVSGIVAPEGWRLEIECKGLRTPTSDDQRKWGAHIRRSGGIHVVVRVRRGDCTDSAVARAVAAVAAAIRLRREGRCPS